MFRIENSEDDNDNLFIPSGKDDLCYHHTKEEPLESWNGTIVKNNDDDDENGNSNSNNNDNNDDNNNIYVNCHHKTWTKEEDNTLLQLYKERGSKWTSMHSDLSRWTRIEIKTRFRSLMRAYKKIWKKSEDELLLNKCYNIKTINWEKISLLFPGRSINSLKNRFKQLINSKKGTMIPLPASGSPYQLFVDNNDESLLSVFDNKKWKTHESFDAVINEKEIKRKKNDEQTERLLQYKQFQYHHQYSQYQQSLISQQQQQQQNSGVINNNNLIPFPSSEMRILHHHQYPITNSFPSNAAILVLSTQMPTFPPTFRVYKISHNEREARMQ